MIAWMRTNRVNEFSINENEWERDDSLNDN